jgi:amino acid transporter
VDRTVEDTMSGTTAELAPVTGTADAWGERLPRQLGLWSAMGAIIANTIGTGIYRVPASTAAELGRPGPMLLVWVVGGVIAVCGALSLAEVVAAIPRSGGLMRILHAAYGPLPAFLLGLAEVFVIAPAGIGAVALIFGEYFARLVGIAPQSAPTVGALALLASGTLNWVGVRRAAALMNASTLSKYLGLALLVVLALLFGQRAPGSAGEMAGGTVGAVAFASALVPVMFCYEGWADISRIAGEVREPGRNLPRAMIGAGLLVALIYLAVNLAYLRVMSPAEMAGRPLVAAAAAERIPLLGGAGASLVALLVLVSAFGNLLGGVMVYARTQFAMAEHGFSLGPLARVSPRFRTPSVAVWVITLLSMVSVFSGAFHTLAGRFVLGLWPFYCLAVGAVFVLRRKRPDLPRPYRTIGYPIVPLVCLAGAGGMLVNALINDPVNSAITFGLIGLGVPIYWVVHRRGTAAQRSRT